MGRDPRNGGNHQTHSYPADKLIPKGVTKICSMYSGWHSPFEWNAEQHRIMKKQHRKRARAWARKLERTEIGR
jgi:hypothetical protein